VLVSDCTVGVARVAQLSKETLNQCEIDLLHAADSTNYCLVQLTTTEIDLLHAADSGVVGGVH